MKKNTIIIYYENGNKEVINFNLNFINTYTVGGYESVEEYIKDTPIDEDISLNVLEPPLLTYIQGKFEDYLENNNIKDNWEAVNNYIVKTGKYITYHLGIKKIKGNIVSEDSVYFHTWEDDLIKFEDDWLLDLDLDNSDF